MILVDTCVWIDHLRSGNNTLGRLLADEQVACHPFIIGELACGNLSNRRELLTLLDTLPKAAMAEHVEVLAVINRHRLFGRGLGWIDAHLLASSLLSKCQLWTLDKSLADAALRLGVAYGRAT